MPVRPAVCGLFRERRNQQQSRGTPRSLVLAVSLALWTVHTGMAELVAEETWVHEALEEEEVTPVPSAVTGRTIPVEGRPERPRPQPEAAPPAERRREAEPGVKPPVAAGPSVPPAKEAPRAPPPTVAPAAAPPPPRAAAEAAAPARPPREEKKAGKKKLKERLARIGRGRHWAHIGGVLLRFLQLACFCVSFSVIAASGDNGLLFSDFQVGGPKLVVY